jgi:hypothetical protein
MDSFDQISKRQKKKEKKERQQTKKNKKKKKKGKRRLSCFHKDNEGFYSWEGVERESQKVQSANLIEKISSPR